MVGGAPAKFQSIPLDAFSTRGQYPAGLSYSGTKRYYSYGVWPRGNVLVLEWDLHFSVAREPEFRTCAECVCAGTRFHTDHGTTGLSRIPHKTAG